MIEINDFDVTGGEPEPAPPVADVHETPVSEPAAPDISEKASETAEEAAVHEPEPDASDRDEKGRFKPKSDKPRDNPIARMKQATDQAALAKKERDEAIAEAARYRAELEAARRPQPRQEPQAQPTGELKPPPPFKEFLATFFASKPDATYEDGVEAWMEAKETFKDRKAEADREQATQREHLTKFRDQIASAKQKYPDWDAVAAQGDAAIRAAGVDQLPPVMIQAILSSDKGAEIMRDLATHPEAAIQLAKDSATVPASAARVMRSLLEGRLATAASTGSVAPPVRPVAPAPIRPVGSAPVVSDVAPNDDADLDTHIAYYNRATRRRP